MSIMTYRKTARDVDSGKSATAASPRVGFSRAAKLGMLRPVAV
jgi:hypothetical protein